MLVSRWVPVVAWAAVSFGYVLRKCAQTAEQAVPAVQGVVWAWLRSPARSR